MRFILHHPRATIDHMGLIPDWLSDDSELSTIEQLNQGYQHGGGWRPFKGFTKDEHNRLHYPGDPPTLPLASIQMKNGDMVVLYPHAWVAVINPEGKWEVCRMD